MNQNSMAIVLLCSHLCMSENLQPYKPAEWSALADRLADSGHRPCDLLSFPGESVGAGLSFTPEQTARIRRLTDRSGEILRELEIYAGLGVGVITQADSCYPNQLAKKLGKSSPPLFYYAGNKELAGKKCVGFVGSRIIGAEDEAFTTSTVEKVTSRGFSIVSGGARGVDAVASGSAIGNGNSCVEYISDSLIRRISSGAVRNALASNRLLIMSAVVPEMIFTKGIAMMRNRFIYAHSEGAVIVKSDYNIGGTWHGGITSLRQRLCATFCWNNPEYAGNLELIRRGAIPIDKAWDGDVYRHIADPDSLPEQLTLYE